MNKYNIGDIIILYSTDSKVEIINIYRHEYEFIYVDLPNHTSSIESREYVDNNSVLDIQLTRDRKINKILS